MDEVRKEYSVAAHWAGDYAEKELQAWAEDLRHRLAGPTSLGLIFLGPKFFPHAPELLEVLRVHAHIPLLVGCSSTALIAGGEEIEKNPGLVLGLFHLPGANLRAVHFTQQQLEQATSPSDWHRLTGVARDQTNGWLVLADPFHLSPEGWLKSWSEAYPAVPVLGGLAGAEDRSPSVQLYLNGEVFEEGGVALSVAGEVTLEGAISQACTPIGDAWAVTRAEPDLAHGVGLVHEIGNRPAYEVLAETFGNLSAREQRELRGNLFVGLAINEYVDEFHRGDFLIRNLLGADPKSGTIAIGAFARPGQTLQFQRRDAQASREDMELSLERARVAVAKRTVYGGCLCACNGRGQHLFGEPSYDARQVQAHFGPLGLAGFFCNGEFGPVGGKNFIHGYTAVLALFVSKTLPAG